jgi:membrane protein DedA with SNARE-associated domain
VQDLIVHYGFLIVALIIFAGEIGLPTFIPGEVALLVAGSQCVHSTPQLIGAILLFGVVDSIATSTIHVASRTTGNMLLVSLLRYLQHDNARAEAMLARWRNRLGGYDAAVVFVTRLIPMFRLYASITTGLIKIRLRHFWLGAVPAAFVWATTPLTLGYLMRSRVGSLTGQYPVLMRDVIISSIILTAAMAAIAWVRTSGVSPLVLRRARLTLGVLAVMLAWGRLASLAAGVGAAGHSFLLSALPAVPTRAGIMAVAAVGLLWIASRDLRAMRSQQLAMRSIGAGTSFACVGLTAVVALVAAWNGHATLL